MASRLLLLRRSLLNELTNFINDEPGHNACDLLSEIFRYCTTAYAHDVEQPFKLLTAKQYEEFKKKLRKALPKIERSLFNTMCALGSESVVRFRKVRSGLQFLEDELLDDLTLHMRIKNLCSSDFVQEIGERLVYWRIKREQGEYTSYSTVLRGLPSSHYWWLARERSASEEKYENEEDEEISCSVELKSSLRKQPVRCEIIVAKATCESESNESSLRKYLGQRRKKYEGDISCSSLGLKSWLRKQPVQGLGKCLGQRRKKFEGDFDETTNEMRNLSLLDTSDSFYSTIYNKDSFDSSMVAQRNRLQRLMRYLLKQLRNFNSDAGGNVTFVLAEINRFCIACELDSTKPTEIFKMTNTVQLKKTLRTTFSKLMPHLREADTLESRNTKRLMSVRDGLKFLTDVADYFEKPEVDEVVSEHANRFAKFSLGNVNQDCLQRSLGVRSVLRPTDLSLLEQEDAVCFSSETRFKRQRNFLSELFGFTNSVQNAEVVLFKSFQYCITCVSIPASPLMLFSKESERHFEVNIRLALRNFEESLSRLMFPLGAENVIRFRQVRSGLEFLKDELVKPLQDATLDNLFDELYESNFVQVINSRLAHWKNDGIMGNFISYPKGLSCLPPSHSWWLEKEQELSKKKYCKRSNKVASHETE